MNDKNEARGEPTNEVSSKENLGNGSRENTEKWFSKEIKEGSMQGTKAQIFTEILKEDYPQDVKQSSSSTFQRYQSPSLTSVSQKSTPDSKSSISIGSTSAGPCKTFTTTSTGSIKTEEVKKPSKTSSKIHEGSKESISSKGSIKSHESPIKETPSYGSEGPCRVYDTVSIDKDISQTSAEQVAHETIGQILRDNIPISAKGIVTDIVDVAVDRGSAKELARGIIEDVLSSKKSLLKQPRKSQDISFTPDDEYLKKHLGVPLTHALVEIVMKQPEDPIHYLAHWLFKWRWNQEYKQQKEDEVNELTLERLRIKEEAEERERIEAEREAIEEERKMANEEAQFAVEEAMKQALHSLGIKDEGSEMHIEDGEEPEIQEEVQYAAMEQAIQESSDVAETLT